MAKIAETPLMKQYIEAKKQHPDAVLLFRVGDFYETFSDDAVTASEILGITLTRRANGAAQYVELAGFPHHALDTYLPKLVRAGKRVAICEQLEDPKTTKKLVKRGITELVTPGVAVSDTILNNRENNFLAAVHFGRRSFGISFLDISTGEFLVAQGSAADIEKLLANFAPKEVLVMRGNRRRLDDTFKNAYAVFELDDWIFTSDAAMDRLLRQFETQTLKGFGIGDMHDAVIAAGAVLHYLDITKHTAIGHIRRVATVDEGTFVRMDRFTVRNLELIQSTAEEGMSLLDVIDHTVTPMGARLLRRWILFPLKNPSEINDRLDVVEYFMKHPDEREAVVEALAQTGDLERLISKVAVGRVTPREVSQTATALKALETVKTIGSGADCGPLRALADQLNLCAEIRDRICRELADNPPANLSRGGVIRAGVSEALDELRDITVNAKDYLEAIRRREIELTGIPSLKIAYNNVFGYYLEVTNTHRDKVPEQWIRKQTLVNAERYITPELKEYEEKILTAQDKIDALEARLYAELTAALARYIPAIQLNARIAAQLDVLTDFTRVAIDNRYVRPVVDESLDIDITEGRHPVIERRLPPGEPYISNSVSLSNRGTQIMMITGPNMSGKSALLRQTAINVLLAQIGSFVAAEAARIGVVDKIFTRVGASDNISQGESTFMVEMTEAASILNNMSECSLILFDELGRGTSTYDGISIAWAIVEYIHEYKNLHPKTLFATHYHELNEMEASFNRIVNYNVSVREIDGKVVFLRKLERGGSEHSFGIHVAKLAGMPASIVKRAGAVLKRLEASAASAGENGGRDLSKIAGESTGMQLSFFQLDDPVLCQLRDRILDLDINNLTPMAALNKLHDIREILTGKS